MRSIFQNKNTKTNDCKIGVIIISGSCCIPGMAPFDEQARRVVEQAISETDVKASLKIMQAASAYLGGVPKEVLHSLMTFYQSGRMPLPAVLINGSIVSYGVPKIEDIKKALLQTDDRVKSGTGRNE